MQVLRGGLMLALSLVGGGLGILLTGTDLGAKVKVDLGKAVRP